MRVRSLRFAGFAGSAALRQGSNAEDRAKHFAREVDRVGRVIHTLGAQEGVHDAALSVAAQAWLARRDVAVPAVPVAPLAEPDAAFGLDRLDEAGVSTAA